MINNNNNNNNNNRCTVHVLKFKKFSDYSYDSGLQSTVL